MFWERENCVRDKVFNCLVWIVGSIGKGSIGKAFPPVPPKIDKNEAQKQGLAISDVDSNETFSLDVQRRADLLGAPGQS